MYSFKLRCKQFSLALSFAVTINKVQTKSLEHARLYLPRPLFSHMKFYVALFGAKSRMGVQILIKDKNGKVKTKPINIVYKHIFDNVN